MKTITIPNDVMLKNADDTLALDDKGQPVKISFKEFVCKTLLLDPKFGRGYLEILGALEIKNQLEKGGTELMIEDANYDRLMDVMTAPTNTFIPMIAMQVAEFFLAIKNAV